MRNFTSTPQKQPAANVASSVMGFPSCPTSFILTRIVMPILMLRSGKGFRDLACMPRPHLMLAARLTLAPCRATGSRSGFDFEFGDHGKVVGGDQGAAP